MGRRGVGEGSVYKTSDGRWRGAVDLGWQDGQRRRKLVSGKTQQDAIRKMRDAQRSAEQGVVTDAKMTVGAWLDTWLKTVIDGKVNSDNTRAHYRQIVDVHLAPALGKVKLDKLTPEQVDRFLQTKADAGLARTYIGRMRTALAAALRHAERRGMVTRNAGELSVMPRTKDVTPRRSLTAEEARRLMTAAVGERLEALVVVGLTVGLRPGELTGLLWSDLSLDAPMPTLTVSGAMKRGPDGRVARGAVKRSTAGLRTVAIPAMTVAALRAHRARQATERLGAGHLWEDHDLVFGSELGTPLDPSNVRRAFQRMSKRAGLDVGFPYLLRHSAVSLLVDAGVGLEDVADLLGDDPATVLRHYRHKIRAVASAAVRMESVLGEPTGTK